VERSPASSAGAGAGGDTGPSSGGSGPGGPGGGASGGTGPGGSGPGGGGECAQYLDEASPGAVQFALTNERPTSIFVAEEYCQEQFRIVFGGEPEKADKTEFDVSCAEVQTDPNYPLDCDSYGFVEIASGATKTITWSGLLYYSQVMPPVCAAEPSNPYVNACQQGVAPPPDATLSFQAELYSGSGGEEPFTVTQPFDPMSGSVAIPVGP
jgi:hypothetical protein